MWDRVHSLTGVIPAGAFVVLHLATNAQALRGPLAFDTAVNRAARLPLLSVFELLGLWLPLLFHGSYGLYRLRRGRPNLAAYPLPCNWAYVTQRVTGMFLLIFLTLHLGQFRLEVLWGNLNRSDYFQQLCARLGGTGVLGVPWLAVFFLLGIAAVAFHLSNGLRGFCFSWGIARRLGNWVSVLGVLLFILGAATVLYFATGWGLGSSDPVNEVGRPGAVCADSADLQGSAFGSSGLHRIPSALPATRSSR